MMVRVEDSGRRIGGGVALDTWTDTAGRFPAVGSWPAAVRENLPLWHRRRRLREPD